MGQHSRVYQFQGLRDRQEDSHAIVPRVSSEQGPLCAVGVFDGVGTSMDGHLAASIASAAFLMAVLKLAFKKDADLSLRNLTEQAFLQANDAVLKLQRLDKYASVAPGVRPATVGAVAVLSPTSRVTVAYAGDVVAFIQQFGHLVPITDAHTSAAKDKEPDAVTRYLGQENLHPQILVGDLEGEALWLMSDGAYGPLLEAGFVGDPGEFFNRAYEGLFWDNATAVGISLVPPRTPKDRTSRQAHSVLYSSSRHTRPVSEWKA